MTIIDRWLADRRAKEWYAALCAAATVIGFAGLVADSAKPSSLLAYLGFGSLCAVMWAAPVVTIGGWTVGVLCGAADWGFNLVCGAAAAAGVAGAIWGVRRYAIEYATTSQKAFASALGLAVLVSGARALQLARAAREE